MTSIYLYIPDKKSQDQINYKWQHKAYGSQGTLHVTRKQNVLNVMLSSVCVSQKLVLKHVQ